MYANLNDNGNENGKILHNRKTNILIVQAAHVPYKVGTFPPIFPSECGAIFQNGEAEIRADPSPSSMKYLLEIERNRIKFYYVKNMEIHIDSRDGKSVFTWPRTAGKICFFFLSIHASIKIEGESESNFPHEFF